MAMYGKAIEVLHITFPNGAVGRHTSNGCEIYLLPKEALVLCLLASWFLPFCTQIDLYASSGCCQRSACCTWLLPLSSTIYPKCPPPPSREKLPRLKLFNAFPFLPFYLSCFVLRFISTFEPSTRLFVFAVLLVDFIPSFTLLWIPPIY